MEIWKEILDGLYSVSTLGRVKANDRLIVNELGIAHHYKERILKPEITADGHARVVLCNAGIKRRIFVHRLVALAFIDSSEKTPASLGGSRAA